MHLAEEGWMGPSALIGKCWGSRRKLQEQDHELSFNLSLRALLHIQNRELMKVRSSGLEMAMEHIRRE